MNTKQRAWAKQYKGTAGEFIAEAQKLGFTDRSIKYWVKYNWNINLERTK